MGINFVAPGVSIELAQWRARHYRDIRYALRIQLVEGSDLLQGNLETTVTVPRNAVDLILDWRGAPVRDVLVNDVSAVPEFKREHLLIANKHLKTGRNSIRLAFESPVVVSGSAVTRYRDREASAYFERYFARKFPFAKYDLVLVPEFPYGGMEHAGATFLNEERVLFPAPPSATDLLYRAQLIFHETSHQWFGDLVTMRWFDDLWLKEGFANFMAGKATEALLPEYDAWTAFHALKLSAIRTSRNLTIGAAAPKSEST